MNRSVFSLRIALPTALAAAFATVLLLVPAALSDTPSVLWTTPTPKDQAKFTVDSRQAHHDQARGRVR